MLTSESFKIECSHDEFIEIPEANFSSEPLQSKCKQCGLTPLDIAGKCHAK